MPIDYSLLAGGEAPLTHDDVTPVTPAPPKDPTAGIRANLGAAMQTDPDSYAESQRIGATLGVPAPVVDADKPRFQQAERARQVDFTLLSDAPRTADRLQDPEFARIAHDETAQLAAVERALANLNAPRSLGDVVDEYTGDIGASVRQGSMIVELAELNQRRMWSHLGRADPLTEDELRRAGALRRSLTDPSAGYGYLAGAPIVAGEQLPILGYIFGGAVTRGAQGAAFGAVAGGAVGSVVPVLGTGVGAVAGLAATTPFAARYGVAERAFNLESGLAFDEFMEVRDEFDNALDPKLAANAAVAVGLVNASLELVSVAALGRTVTPVGRALVRRKIKDALADQTKRKALTRIAESYATFVAAEGGTEALQELTNILGAEFLKLTDEGAFTEQQLSDSLDAFLGTDEAPGEIDRVLHAFVKGTQGVLVLGGAGATVSTTTTLLASENKHVESQRRLDTVVEAVTEVKTKGRNRAMFQDLVDSIDGDNNSQVHIDAAQVSLYLQQYTPEQVQADPLLSTLAGRAREAAQLGQDMTVTIAEFATDVVDSPHFADLRPHMTLDPQASTPFRVKQERENQRQYMDRLVAEAEKNASEYVDAQDMFTQLREQLVDTGKLTPQQASVSAQLGAAYFVSRAKRLGKPVAEVFRDAGLTIEGPLTGEAAALDARRAELLAQAQTPEFEAWFGESKVVDEGGAPLVVYHGTDADIGAFDPEKAGAFGADFGQAVYFTDSPATASGYSVRLTRSEEFVEAKAAADAAREKVLRAAADFGVGSEEYKAAKAEAAPLEDARRAAQDAAAEFEAPTTGANVIPAHLSLKNPLVVDAKGAHFSETHARAMEDARTGGHDGVVIKNSQDRATGADPETSTVYIAFEPTQIKSAIGNRGTFDPGDPSILRQEAQRAEGIATSRFIAGDGSDTIVTGEGDDLVTVYHGTSEEAAAGIRADDRIDGPVSVTPRRDVAEEYADIDDDGNYVVFELEVPREFLRVDRESFDSEDIAEALDAGAPLYTEQSIALRRAPDPRILRQGTPPVTETPAFKRWFGDSKVVDEKGEPLVVYHGSTADIAAFDPALQGSATSWHKGGFFFAKDSALAGQYAEGSGANVTAAFVAVENPAPSYSDFVEKPEYDGFVNSRIVVARKPEQIKSAIGNRGTFDPADPSILRQEVRGYYDVENVLIRLTDAADLSTFFHEFAHFAFEQERANEGGLWADISGWFTRNAEAVATEAGASAEQVRMYLADGTTTNAVADEAINRALHEQFARGFEAYLMEGKAPSLELRNVFRAVAVWMARVYRAIKGDMQVNLDDQMRAVFDRMLTAEEQVAAAETRAQFEPLFTDAAMAGMTEEQWTKYQEKRDKVTAKANETIRDKLIGEITRQQEAWWKQEKADRVDEATAALREERVYRAREALRTDDMALDHVAVKELVGEASTDKRGRAFTRIPPQLRGMTKKGGLGGDPDLIAASLGYESGVEMLRDVIQAPKLKDVAEQRAQEQMLERHGDVLNDGTIEALADDALESAGKADVLLAELRALKGPNQRTIDNHTMSTLAAEQIARLPFTQINPRRYRAAEIRAAQDAAAALQRGDKTAAAEAKTRQLMNHHLAREATAARDDVVKIADWAGRYGKKSIREKLVRADEGGYLRQIDKILARFEFRKSKSMRAVDAHNEALAAWMQRRMDDYGDEFAVSAAVMDETYVTHWKNVPYSDLLGVRDSLKNLEHTARQTEKIRVGNEEVDFAETVQNWVAHMDAAAPDKFARPEALDVVKSRGYLRFAMGTMTKIPWMASWLDGGERVGTSHGLLARPLNEAYNAEQQLWAQAGAPVIAAIDRRSHAAKKRHNRVLHIPELADTATGTRLVGHQVLAVALNTGNAGNLRKMLLGEGWAREDNDAEIGMHNEKLQAILQHMTKEDWDFVQMVWDQMDTLYPPLAEVHKKATGVAPPKVEAVPVKTPHGTYRGGYYPVKYDSFRSRRAAENEARANEQAGSMFSPDMSLSAQVTAGAANERTKFFDPIRLSLDVVPSHFQETIHYITHYDAVRSINRLIRHPEVEATITAKLGREEYAQLKPWLNDVAKDGRAQPAKNMLDPVLGRLRFGLTLGVMGFKASTGLMQLLGLSNAAGEVGAANMLRAVRSIVGSRQNMRDAWQFAAERSNIMEHRVETMDRELRNAAQRLQATTGLAKEGDSFLGRITGKMKEADANQTWKTVQSVSMQHIALIQTYMVDLPTWYGAYYKGLKEWGDETRAAEYGDWVVEQVHGSGLLKDQAALTRNQNEAMRIMTMFMTFFSALWNTQRDLARGAASGTYSASQIAAKAMFFFTLPVFLEMLMRGEFGGDDDEAALEKYLTQLALYPVASVPFVRDVASGVLGDYGYNMSPVAQLLEKGTQTIPKVVQALAEGEAPTLAQTKGATKTIGTALGVPGTGQAWATGEHLYDVLAEGEELTLQELTFGPKRD